MLLFGGNGSNNPGAAYYIGPPSPAGPTSLSINGGAQYTNNPDVALTPRWGESDLFVTGALLSNDGGFGATKTQPLAGQIPWTLDSSGAERLPKTVYLKYLTWQGRANAVTSDQTWQDDIILDQTPPEVEAIVAMTSTAGAAVISGGKKIKVRIKASDQTSGVADMQVGPTRSASLKRVTFTPVARVARSKRIYVRVFDAAGNASKWRKASVPRSNKKHG